MYNFNKVSSWHRQRKLNDVFGLDVLIIPININRIHWTFIAVDFGAARIEYYDSEWNFSATQVNFAARYLEDVWKMQHADEDPIACSRVREGVPSSGPGYVPASTGKFTIHNMSLEGKIPFQSNGYDCGVFMVQMARCKMFGIPLFLDEIGQRSRMTGAGPPYAFDQADMQYFRALMAAELLTFAEHGLLSARDSDKPTLRQEQAEFRSN